MSNTQNVLQEANALVDAGKPAEAIRQMVAWTNDHPEDAAAWELLAKVHFDLRHWLPARMAATQVTRLRPQSALAWCNLGTILRKMGSPKEAGEAQRRALRLDPTYTRAQVEIAKLQKETGPEAEQVPAVQQFPAAEPAPESDTPVYCRQCRRKIPIVVSDENEGLCGTCLREHFTPNTEIRHGSGFLGIPMWALGAALALVLVFGATFGLMVGRRGHRPHATPNAREEASSAPQQTPGQAPPPARRRAKSGNPARDAQQATAPPQSARSSSANGPSSASSEPSRTATSTRMVQDTYQREEALNALNDISAACDVGISYAKYADYVIPAKQKFDRSANATQFGGTTFWSEASAALDDYVFAQEAWSWEFRSSDHVQYSISWDATEVSRAVGRYPWLKSKARAMPNPFNNAGYSYELLIIEIVQAAWTSASAHTNNARRVLSQP
ncbi:MAG: tetratricopeptide repeat protein [Armatimonadia bacterium]